LKAALYSDATSILLSTRILSPAPLQRLRYLGSCEALFATINVSSSQIFALSFVRRNAAGMFERADCTTEGMREVADLSFGHINTLVLPYQTSF
jgi:hypothetical protein